MSAKIVDRILEEMQIYVKKLALFYLFFINEITPIKNSDQNIVNKTYNIIFCLELQLQNLINLNTFELLERNNRTNY
jgi:hypothetical protein